MFYSATPLKIKEKTSVVDDSQVFTGQYWDEFGVTGHLVPHQARVLMLGLAYGGGIRPILASNKKVELHVVDLDSRTNERCKDQFANHFPEIEFTVHTSDAESYLQNSSETWNAIWIDLYAFDGYIDLLSKREFLNQIKSALKPGGVALFNLFGIPNQFDPLSQPGPQSFIYSAIRKEFAEVRTLPYRRNLTVVASETSIRTYPTESHPDLSGLDKTTFNLLKRRLVWLDNAEPQAKANSLTAEEGKFEHIDQMMRSNWKVVLERLSRLGVKMDRPVQLLDLIQDRRACEEWLRQVESEESWIEFLPILCAGESDLRTLKVDWIFEWTALNQRMLESRFPRVYNQIWLPQLWSMVLHPSKKFRKHYFGMLPLLSDQRD